ncbi:MAG: phosphopantothenoylcysteine decarboxylase [bacterium]|nr:phosphopantothenoylcysteine decarboxylase [bacterium]
MKILITAGGTISRIDDVRHIGNFSSGSFPSKIAEVALQKKHEVIYLHAKKARTPFDAQNVLDLNEAIKMSKEDLKKKYLDIQSLESNLRLASFETVDEYMQSVEKILKKEKVDVIFLAAAVSDYSPPKVEGKISSDKEKLTIELKRTPKVIKHIKKWAPNPIFQVGFKLLSGVSEEELAEAAYKSGLENKSNLTVANDLEKIKNGAREVFLVTPEKGKIKIKEPDVSKKVFEFVEKRAKTTFFKTKVEAERGLELKFEKLFAEMKEAVAELYERNLLEEFYSGSGHFHGSVSLRVDEDKFLITGRETDKRNLKSEEIALVDKVDLKKREVFTRSLSGKKPSLNAVLSFEIFKKFPEANVIVHTHSKVPKIPETSFAYPPGTLEYSLGPIELLKKSRMVSLKDHGQVTIGQDLKETVDYVTKNVK